ncbi:hypothetical protein M413DRAFT_25290 [Hebeloma cylindrosporum]|uniref:Uncharacterized protein n=1 Tax=Hebeloma cylindrosporum TaxID=76867 RepID=A0A0C2Y4T4_HEBCY|nr:hypothetical protein M413DRAFT_25290 [Hebeloma cylindrosporum h7]
MTSSPTSSSSDSSSSPNSSPSLAKFDPFAVHPFTNCSVSQSDAQPHDRQFSTYGYPYGPSLGSYKSLHNPMPQQQVPPAINTPNKSSAKPSVNAYAYPPRPAIFIPFRQDTSSPELPHILKANKSLSKSSTTNDSRTNISYPIATGNTTQPTPNSYPRKS